MDEYSLFAFDPGGGGIDWGSIISRGIDVAGAYASRSPYYSPDDPRYQQRQPAVTLPTYPGGGGQVRTSLDDGAGINLSTNTLMLIGGAILIWMVASRRR